MKTKLVVGALVLCAFFMVQIFCREKIDSGYAGIKVNLYGTDKGVSDIVAVTGAVYYNPFTQSIYEFPVFVQDKSYSDDLSFVVSSKDGTPFKVSPRISYRVQADMAPHIFKKYRKELGELENNAFRTQIIDVFTDIVNGYSVDSLISNRGKLDDLIIGQLKKRFSVDGVVIENLTSNLEYPKSLREAIEAKNNAVQKALKVENDVRQAEASAKIKIVDAEGRAKSMLAIARAEAEANRLRQSTLTKELLAQQWIEAWKSGGSQVPTYISGNGGNNFMLPINK